MKRTTWNKEKLILLRKYKKQNLSNKQISEALDIPFKSICYANTKYRILLTLEERKRKISEAGQKGRAVFKRMSELRGKLSSFDSSLGYVVGVLFGDGSAVDMGCRGCVELRTTNKSFADTFNTALKKSTKEIPKYHIRTYTKRFEKENKTYFNVKYYEVFHNSLYFVRNIVRTFGKTTTKEWNIDINFICSLGEDFCLSLIRGLFDSEGSFSMNDKGKYLRGDLSFSTTNNKGAKNLQLLLNTLGINCKLYQSLRKNKFYEFRIRTGKRDTIKRFYEKIGFSIDYKQARLKKFVEHISQES